MTTFQDLAMLAEELGATGSRLRKRELIAEAIGRAHADHDGQPGLFAQYLAGLPFAEADPRKLNAGGALLGKALREVSGATDAAMTAAYRRHGDMGAAAGDLLEGKGPQTGADGTAGLILREVERVFAGMAIARSTAERAGLVTGMLHAASAVEAKYLLKLMLGDMRIGVKQSLVEEAIGVAAQAPVAAVRHAVMLEADLAGAVARAFAGTLEEARMRLFHPLGFMLASPVETPEEAVERFSEKPKKPAAPPKKGGRKKKGDAVAATDAETDPENFVDAPAEDTLAVPPEGEADAELAVKAVQLSAGSSGAEEPAIGGAAELAMGGRPGVEALLEDKYDGMRAQVHCGDPEQPGRVAIYSRNREDITESFPDLVEAFAAVPGTAGGLILDGEILGWEFGAGEDGAGRALPFAVMGQRIGRKRVDNELRRTVPAVFMAFDLLYSEGELRLDLPLRERRRRLEAMAAQADELVRSPLEIAEVPKASKGRQRAGQAEMFAERVADGDEAHDAAPTSPPPVRRWMVSPARVVEDAAAIDLAYAEARARANEGVMLKAAGSAYLPGRRGLAWVKLKRELATLDVVITGAEYGSGRKSQVLSDYTFAVRGPGGELLNVGKAYSGVTDAEIVELTEWLKAHTIEDLGHFRTVEPLMVLEVAFNNVMVSDRHASGFALRFPRILHLRRDKPVEEIDTVDRVREVYESQVDRPAEPLGSL